MKLRSALAAVGSLVSLVSLGLVVGCAAEGTGDDGDEALDHDSADVTAAVPKSLCFCGATFTKNPYDTGGTPEIAQVCNQLPGLIRDDWNQRDSAYPFFRWDSDLNHVVDVLVSALDTNHDGVVTNTDAPVDLNVVGYSWGGFNARDVILKIGSDRRFSPSRKIVSRYIALDPFRTDVLVIPKGGLTVPANVKSFWEIRHTVAPAGDCSLLIPQLVGPFTGRDPRCTGTTACRDFDFSARAQTKNVDHCTLPTYARPAVIDIALGRTPTNLPPERPVARY